MIKSEFGAFICQIRNNYDCHTIGKRSSANTFHACECFDNVLEIKASRGGSPHKCLCFVFPSLRFQVYFQASHCLRNDNAVEETAQSYTLTDTVVYFCHWLQWLNCDPRGHFGGPLSAQAKRVEPGGRTKKMICGQSGTVLLLKLCAVHAEAAE